MYQLYGNEISTERRDNHFRRVGDPTYMSENVKEDFKEKKKVVGLLVLIFYSFFKENKSNSNYYYTH